MEPAKSIIKKLGGPTIVAKEIGLSRVTVSRWGASKSKGGTNGFIPYSHVPKLLKFAREREVELSASDFIPDDDPIDFDDHPAVGEVQ